MLAQVELIDQRSHLVGVNAALRGDQAGSDFDDESHGIGALQWATTRFHPNDLAPRRSIDGIETPDRKMEVDTLADINDSSLS